jgi:hypothetical protein
LWFRQYPMVKPYIGQSATAPFPFVFVLTAGVGPLVDRITDYLSVALRVPGLSDLQSVAHSL